MSFDILAPHYRWMEFVLAGGLLQRCRTTWLNEVKSARHVLLAGEGNGRFISVCARELPAAKFVCVDASAAMLRQAQRRWVAAGGTEERMKFCHAELPAWEPPHGEFDLIVTNYFLDCFPPALLRAVIETLAKGAAPQAQWLVADFAVPEKGIRRWRAKTVLRLAYTFFRIATRLPARKLCPPDPELERVGFCLRHRRTFNADLLHADLWERQTARSIPSF